MLHDRGLVVVNVYRLFRPIRQVRAVRVRTSQYLTNYVTKDNVAVRSNSRG